VQLVFPLDPVADNPRAVMRRTTKVELPSGHGTVVDPQGAHEEVRITGSCYTTLFQWVRADSITRVDDRSQLPPPWVLGIMQGAYRMEMGDPATALGFKRIPLGVATSTSYPDLLGVINTCLPTPAIYFALGLSPFRMGSHIVGFKVTTDGGDYLDPASGLYRANSRPALLWGIYERIKGYVDRMQACCPAVEVELWAIEPE
jgi:hypothetical protein